MKRCVYAGSFDPITFGHLWMIEQGSRMFDELVVAIGINPDKRYLFTLEERLTALRSATQSLPSVRVASYENLYLVTYAKQIGANFILRGVRNEQDYGYERGMRYVNAEFDPNIQTIFLIPPRQLCEVSSSFVKGLVGPRGWEHILPKYVPTAVNDLFVMKHAVARWTQIFAALGVPKEKTPDPSMIIQRYQNPPRAYHNLRHIVSCLSEFDEVRSHARDPLSIELALWFHDCIYDPMRNDNEEQSAQAAQQLLQAAGISANRLEAIKRFIIATKHTTMPADPDEQLMVDIDLSILGQASEIYDRYETAIREEYRHVDESAFRTGRTKVLNTFLSRPRIFATDLFREKYEQSARSNLKRAIAAIVE